jgi:hypothetical protein
MKLPADLVEHINWLAHNPLGSPTNPGRPGSQWAGMFERNREEGFSWWFAAETTHGVDL